MSQETSEFNYIPFLCKQYNFCKSLYIVMVPEFLVRKYNFRVFGCNYHAKRGAEDVDLMIGTSNNSKCVPVYFLLPFH